MQGGKSQEGGDVTLEAAKWRQAIQTRSLAGHQSQVVASMSLLPSTSTIVLSKVVSEWHTSSGSTIR